jgi:5-deoxy-glucuronate isomerase
MSFFLPRGETATPPFELDISPERAGWAFSGLRVLALEPGGSHAFDTGEDELIVLPLEGGCVVRVDGQELAIAGRESVFTQVTDFVYVPRDARLEIGSERGGRFAFPSARAKQRLEPCHVAAEDVPVELRGAGRASRQVINFCAPAAFPADRLIAVEVLTPAGHWSSYPPHKHDTDDLPREAALEETYYHRLRGGSGFALQRVYTDDPTLDEAIGVTDGDVVLVPRGYHPVAGDARTDLYYLNVMAGPSERVWRFRDDPAHAWIRSTWEDEEIDPRLPLARAGRQT